MTQKYVETHSSSYAAASDSREREQNQQATTFYNYTSWYNKL